MWPCPLITPWPWSFKVRVWNSIISGMGRPIDMEEKGCDGLRTVLSLQWESIYLKKWYLYWNKAQTDLTTLFCMFDRQYYPSVHPSLGLHLLKLAKIQIYLDRHTEARTHLQQVHDDAMLCKCFLHNWPIVRGIHQWLVNSPHKGPVTFVTGIHQWLVDSPHKGASIAELWYLLCL